MVPLGPPIAILVIDDSARIREVARTMLQASSYEVAEADREAEAPRLARARPDVLVLGVGLPDADAVN